MLLSQNVGPAGVPTSLASNTVKAASLFAAGQTAAAGLISGKAAALSEGVLKAMLLSKIKIAVIASLVIIALGTGISGLTRQTWAADPAPAAKAATAFRDDANLKETVLALEKRIWEAHSKQDVDAFKNLLANDFLGIDMFGRPYDKAAELVYVSNFRVIEHTMKDVKVVILNATSALVSYQIDYKVRPTNGKEVESTKRRVTAAWTQRKGRWWYAYFEDRLVPDDTFAPRWGDQPFWPLSEQLREINKPKPPAKKQ